MKLRFAARAAHDRDSTQGSHVGASSPPRQLAGPGVSTTPGNSAEGFGHSLTDTAISPADGGPARYQPPPTSAPLQLGRTKGKQKIPWGKQEKGELTESEDEEEEEHGSDVEEEKPPGVSLKIHAFNINHLSGDTSYKLKALQDHLDEHAPDVLALSEVNNPEILEQYFGRKKSAYRLVLPQSLQTGQSIFNEKTSAQNETYPLLVKKTSGLSASYVGTTPQADEGPKASLVRGSSGEQEEDPIAWKHFRPTPLFAVTHPEGGSFLLGSVHTSPGFSKLGTQTATYARGLGSVLDQLHGPSLSARRKRHRIPGALVGDFYNPKQQFQKRKVEALKSRFEISKPELVTNYSPDQIDGEKEAADFVIATKDFLDPETGETRALFPPFEGSDEGYEDNPAKAWAKYPREHLDLEEEEEEDNTEQVSDHAPIETHVHLDNVHSDHEPFAERARAAIARAQEALVSEQQQRKAESVSSGSLLGKRKATQQGYERLEQQRRAEPPKKKKKRPAKPATPPKKKTVAKKSGGRPKRKRGNG